MLGLLYHAAILLGYTGHSQLDVQLLVILYMQAPTCAPASDAQTLRSPLVVELLRLVPQFGVMR